MALARRPNPHCKIRRDPSAKLHDASKREVLSETILWITTLLFNDVQPLIGKTPNQAVHNILQMKASGVLCPTQSSCLNG